MDNWSYYDHNFISRISGIGYFNYKFLDSKKTKG
jgi:hypothetical protein